MKLYQALNLKQREIIAFVGAGGKTSALSCLARELVSLGRRVVVAPTTKMHFGQLRELAEPVIAEDAEILQQKVLKSIKKSRLVTCGATVNNQSKVTGLSEETVKALSRLDIDYLLLEGDGAAGAIFKAPAFYEPVIPKETTMVVALASLRVIGQPMEAPFVHRPQIMAGLLGKEEGSPITADDVARLMVHPHGGLKEVPPGARWIPVLNRAESHELLATGRITAEKIISAGHEKVILGAVATPYPVRQVIKRHTRGRNNVGAVILAAGCGNRIGGGKQLLPVADQPMVRHIVSTVLKALPENIVVVLGYNAGKVAAALQGLEVDFAFNPAFSGGLSSSLQAGLAALSSGTQAALFVLADQPAVTPQVLTRLIEAYRRSGKKIIVPVYHGVRGNPVIIDRSLWGQIFALQGDTGAREIIKSYPEEVERVEVDCPGILVDIDTLEDYLAWSVEEGSERCI